MTSTVILILSLTFVAGCYLALCFVNLSLAAALFCGLLPTYLYRFALPALPGLLPFRLPMTFLEILFLELLLGCLLDKGVRSRIGETLRRWAYPLLLLVVAAVISTAVSPDTRAALGLLRAYIVEPLLFFLIFPAAVTDARYRRLALGALGVSLAVVGVACVYQKITGYAIPFIWRDEPGRRVTAFYGFPNAVGLFAAPVAALMAAWAVALAWKSKGATRLFAALPAAAAVLGALAVVFAVSEGAAIGLAAGVLAFGLFWKPIRVAGLTAVIIGCMAVMVLPPLRDYVSYKADLRDDSGSVRVIVWSESLHMLAEHPVFGAGLSGYPLTLTPYHKADWIEIFQYPHDFILNFWTELGLIGLIGFLWALTIFFKDNISAVRRHPEEWLPSALLAAMTALLVHGLVDVPYFKNDLAFLFWIIVGLGDSVRRQMAERQKPRKEPRPKEEDYVQTE